MNYSGFFCFFFCFETLLKVNSSLALFSAKERFIFFFLTSTMINTASALRARKKKFYRAKTKNTLREDTQTWTGNLLCHIQLLYLLNYIHLFLHNYYLITVTSETKAKPYVLRLAIKKFIYRCLCWSDSNTQ